MNLGKTTVAQHDPILSESREPASSESEEILVDVPTDNWADYMELVEGLAELKPEPSKSASQQQLGLAAHHDDNEQDAFLSSQYTAATALVSPPRHQLRNHCG